MQNICRMHPDVLWKIRIWWRAVLWCVRICHDMTCNAHGLVCPAGSAPTLQTHPTNPHTRKHTHTPLHLGISCIRLHLQTTVSCAPQSRTAQWHHSCRHHVAEVLFVTIEAPRWHSSCISNAIMPSGLEPSSRTPLVPDAHQEPKYYTSQPQWMKPTISAYLTTNDGKANHSQNEHIVQLS